MRDIEYVEILLKMELFRKNLSFKKLCSLSKRKYS